MYINEIKQSELKDQTFVVLRILKEHQTVLFSFYLYLITKHYSHLLLSCTLGQLAKNQFQSTFISREISFVYMHGNIDDTYQRTNFLFFYFDESKCILLCIRPVANNTSATLKTKIICFGALKEVGKERRIELQNAKCSQNSSKDLIIVIFDI